VATRIAILITLFATVSVFLFGCFLSNLSEICCEIQEAFLSSQWMLLVCLCFWCCTLIFLTFSLKDWWLILFLLGALGAFFINFAMVQSAIDAVILLTGITFCKGAKLLLKSGNISNAEAKITINQIELQESKVQSSDTRKFLIGLIALMTISAFWHLEAANRFYPGTRWTGLWDNPNIYGMLMGAGLTIAIGFIVDDFIFKVKNAKLLWFLYPAVGVMVAGLFFSYSRGAWVATAVGLLYLAKAHGKLKLHWAILGGGVGVAVVIIFWHSTADNGSWYLKRLDLSRPSVQHRLTAWRGALQMMWDHPLGVGWNEAVNICDKNYSPVNDSAAALATNSYLILGTELGIPALLCFVAYVGLCLRGKGRMQNEEFRIQTACRAGAIVLLVAFWFDGGLFNLPTATVFWVLLELGAVRGGKVDSCELMVDCPKT